MSLYYEIDVQFTPKDKGQILIRDVVSFQRVYIKFYRSLSGLILFLSTLIIIMVEPLEMRTLLLLRTLIFTSTLKDFFICDDLCQKMLI